MQFLKSIFMYSMKSRWLFLLLFLGAAAILVFDLYSLVSPKDLSNIANVRNNLWTPILEHYIAFGTFLAALAAWFSSVKRDWIEGLPKRLSVKFWHDGNIVMQCDYAYLSGESDIRQMGQQIGAQISSEYQLKFNAAEIVWNEEPIVYGFSQTQTKSNYFKGKFPFRHYSVKYELSVLPATLQKNHRYLWLPPFDKRLDEKDIGGDLQYNKRIKIKSSEYDGQNENP